MTAVPKGMRIACEFGARKCAVGVGIEHVADTVVLVVDAEDDILRRRDYTLREVDSSSRWPHGGRQLSRVS